MSAAVSSPVSDPATSRVNTPASIPVSADDAAAAIEMLRTHIDAMDTAIARLVAERAKLSTRIQTTRINAGGTRVELGRERVIMATYRDALGPNGPSLADAVLQICRGTR